VTHVEHLGGDTNVVLRGAGDTDITLRLFGQHEIGFGEALRLGFPPDKAFYFDADGRRVTA
jgi:multiple sugar transport system ATP-binding protein